LAGPFSKNEKILAVSAFNGAVLGSILLLPVSGKIYQDAFLLFGQRSRVLHGVF
jgi:hypothetical protein